MISPPPRSPLFPYTTLFRSPDSAPNLRSSAEFSLSPQLKSSTLAARIMINWIAIFIVHLQQLKLMGGDDSTRRAGFVHAHCSWALSAARKRLQILSRLRPSKYPYNLNLLTQFVQFIELMGRSSRVDIKPS